MAGCGSADDITGTGTTARNHQRTTQFTPLQVTHVTFANNVRLHYRFMDFKKTTSPSPSPWRAAKSMNRRRTVASLISPLWPWHDQQPDNSLDRHPRLYDRQEGRSGRAHDRRCPGTRRHWSSRALEEGLQLAYLLLQDARLEAPGVTLWKQQKLQMLESIRTVSTRVCMRSRGWPRAAMMYAGRP